MGDHTLTISLTALSVFYVYYLTEYAGLRPALAGTVPLIGRFFDAVTDPLMGRLSDLTRLRAGRRRPYFLIGVFPFAASFALLWTGPPVESQLGMFAFYSAIYVLYSLCSTVLTVPYLALLPEIAPGYDERSSLNAWRAALAILGTLAAAVGFRPLAGALGGGSEGFFAAACVLGAWMVWPWLALYGTVRERPDFQRPAHFGFVEGMRLLAGHRTYRWVTGLYLSGRIAMDVTGMILVFYFQHWMGRPGDFEIMFFAFLLFAIACLPIWLRLARTTDKRTVFVAGALWWAAIQVSLFAATPDWPRWLPILMAVLAAAGYGIVDMMPWSMLADVVDEDELRTGERREGVYSGVFGFLRKLGGAIGVWIAGLALDVAGFVPGAEQGETVRQTIRILTVGVPPLFLLLAVAAAWRYPLGRERHAEIVAELRERREGGKGTGAAP
jgi:sugar (glycoside-pentoside-hexuronide) transporter